MPDPAASALAVERPNIFAAASHPRHQPRRGGIFDDTARAESTREAPRSSRSRGDATAELPGASGSRDRRRGEPARCHAGAHRADRGRKATPHRDLPHIRTSSPAAPRRRRRSVFATVAISALVAVIAAARRRAVSGRRRRPRSSVGSACGCAGCDRDPAAAAGDPAGGTPGGASAAARGGPDRCAARVHVTRLEDLVWRSTHDRPTVLRVAISAALLAVMVYLAMPDIAGAALQSAAGGKPGSGGVRALRAVHQPRGRLHDPDRRGVQRAGAGVGRDPLPGGRRARAACSASSRSGSASCCCRSRSPPDDPPPRVEHRARDAGRAAHRAGERAGAVGLPGLPNPLDLGVPNPVELIGNVFEYVLETFFGLETKVTQRTVSWLLAAPVYTDQGAYRELNELRGSIEVAAWALFTLVFCVSAVRYASGFTSAGSYEAVEALARGGLAAGTMVLYPQAFGCWRSPPTG